MASGPPCTRSWGVSEVSSLSRLTVTGSHGVLGGAPVRSKCRLVCRALYVASKTTVAAHTASFVQEVGRFGIAFDTLPTHPVQERWVSRKSALGAKRTRVTDSVGKEPVLRSAVERRLIGQEVGAGVVAMLNMARLCAADMALSAGMVAL